MDLEFLEENRSVFVFLIGTIITITLLTLIVFIGVDPGIGQYIQYAAIIIFVGSFSFFMVDLIRSTWETPDVPAEDLVMYFGIFLIIVIIFVYMALKPPDWQLTSILPFS